MNSLRQLDRPIFVVGHPRSGTTLLASMLGRHPDIASTPESLYFTETRFYIRPYLHKGASLIFEKIISTQLGQFVLDKTQFLQTLKQYDHIQEKEIFTALLANFLSAKKKTRILEKTPVHIRHIDELLRWYPDAKIILIVRDGRAAISSLLKVDWATKDLKVLARQWLRNLSFALMYLEQESASIEKIFYEDLLNNPKETMKRAMKFIEVDYSETVFDHAIKVDTIRPFETGWKKNVNKPLNAHRELAWEEELSAEEKQTISIIINPLLARLGYTTIPPSKRYILQICLERIRYMATCNRPMLKIMKLVFPFLAQRRAHQK